MSEVVLEVRHIVRNYGKFRAVRDVSFDLKQGETLTLLGPSGCGKSTTLRAIAGLERIDAGEIVMRQRLIASAERGISLPPERRNIGLVFQSYAVWPHMTVFENVAFPLRSRRAAKQEIERRVLETLTLVGLGDLAARRATTLSGGQQQRVALARALVYEPDIVLLDEPLSNLDARRRQTMRVYLKELQNRLGITMLFVTHDQVEAMTLSHRIAVMNEGRIEQIGTPRELYLEAETPFVHGSVGNTLTFPGTIVARGHAVGLDIGGAVIPLDDLELPVGARVVVSMRPADLEISRVGSGTAAIEVIGSVEQVSFLGDRLECAVRLGEHRIVIDAPRTMGLVADERVALRFPPSALRVWPA